MRKFLTNLILFAIFIFGSIILGYLYFFQVVKTDFYSALAQGQNSEFLKLQGERGKIFLKDKEGDLYLAATSRSGKFCFAFLNEMKDKEESAFLLSEALDIEKDDLLSKIEEGESFLVIKEDLSEEEVKKIKDLELKGIQISDQKIREYPYAELASDVLGFVNKDGEGQYGLEEYYDKYLKGKEKFLVNKKDPDSYLSFLDQENIRGDDIVLTLDYNIQFQAEKLLLRAKEKYNIEEGQIIVMNPSSGKILAMADFPNFNPNSYGSYDLDVFKNDAIRELFEPGSVFKAITMAAALNEEKITPQTTFDDPGKLVIGGWPIYNYDQRSYGNNITMTEVLEKSINTGAVFAEERLGHDNFLKYLESFDVFTKTGIDLAGENYSENKEFKKGYEVNFATASFGQGVEMTPLQLIKSFSVLTNGGKEVKPYIVEGKIVGDEFSSMAPQQEEGKVILPIASSKITAMLVSVVENGFAKGAQVPGYYVAGKTGTSQIPYSSLGENKRGYSDKTWQTFIGYAPAFNPEFIILVKLDNPNTSTASYSAVPIFQELASYIIDYLQIPSDY